ncbi:MAG TPA: J domain-containing protein [Thermoanaerobaculia bacterium]|nr:J domain-containing protein [Thermoanaerobaculia bacterium]HQP88370.1 J domain-containing protein [Thermoanaerobaculia bacterium]
MRQRTRKDPYSVLGVEPSATADEIRAAYVARSRVVHPDRFDSTQQPDDWRRANEMLAELNEAYAILRNVGSKAEYDSRGREESKATTPPPRRTEPASPPRAAPPPFEVGELTPGRIPFSEMPKEAQERLVGRQTNAIGEQFKEELGSPTFHYVFAALLIPWFVYLVTGARGLTWNNEVLAWHAGLTVVACFLLGWNVIAIRRWRKGPLRPHLFLTPIYLIKTEHDLVAFWPIWALKDLRVTHNYRNGSYQNSTVVLVFNGSEETVTFRSKLRTERFVERLRDFEHRIRLAYQAGDAQFFRANDDFYRVPRSAIGTAPAASNDEKIRTYVGTLVAGGALLVFALLSGQRAPETRSTASSSRSSTAPPAVPTLPPAQPLPGSGLKGMSGVDEPWKEDWDAPLQIKAAQGSHFFVKLVDVNRPDVAITLFVRGGQTLDVEVPLGTFEIRYASGTTWYGDEYLFGPETTYSKADKLFTFEIVGNQVRGFTITLYKVAHGNLSTSKIRASEF